MENTVIVNQPTPRQHTLAKLAGGLMDLFLFLSIMAFTALAIIAVAIVAPLAMLFSVITGRHKQARAGWHSAKAS